ncbi:hypothetical protein SADUNF_Sadunf01G0045800 [Salix dunnii]|uniref:Uncharacterized protein n=1 Tax=Salix dunnii TaxID=1413687 RepID=A0A835TJ03_9ROSI|nr:hypothetical protein SADUNF_Sadunf01G0045800 [Salix dunnii]
MRLEELPMDELEFQDYIWHPVATIYKFPVFSIALSCRFNAHFLATHFSPAESLLVIWHSMHVPSSPRRGVPARRRAAALLG